MESLPNERLTSNIQKGALVIVILTWIFCAYSYAGLPDQMPLHYGLSGEADRWGRKMFLFILPIIGLITYWLLSISLEKFSDAINYPVEITEENKAAQFAIAKEQMQVINFLCVSLIAFLSWEMVQIANAQKSGLNTWAIILFLVLIFVAIWWYYRKAKAHG